MANKKISVSILKHCFSEIILFSVTFSVGQDLFFGEASRVMRFSLARFACFQLNWATTTGRLLGFATCLPHSHGGYLFSALPKDITNELAGFLSTQSSLCSAQSRKAVNTMF